MSMEDTGRGGSTEQNQDDISTGQQHDASDSAYWSGSAKSVYRK